jgi:hypothetical protein
MPLIETCRSCRLFSVLSTVLLVLIFLVGDIDSQDNPWPMFILA